MVMRICLVGKKDGNVSDLFFLVPLRQPRNLDEKNLIPMNTIE